MKQDFHAINERIRASIDPVELARIEKDVAADVALLKIAIDLRITRREAGLTQAQLAEKSGITQAEISRIEKGRYSPRLVTFLRLARALKKDFVITGAQDAVSKVA